MKTWLIRLAILGFVAYGTVTLLNLRAEIREKESQAAVLSEKVAAAHQENQRLQEDIDALDTDEGIKDTARKKLGMIASGEIVFHDVGNE